MKPSGPEHDGREHRRRSEPSQGASVRASRGGKTLIGGDELAKLGEIRIELANFDDRDRCVPATTFTKGCACRIDFPIDTSTPGALFEMFVAFGRRARWWRWRRVRRPGRHRLGSRRTDDRALTADTVAQCVRGEKTRINRERGIDGLERGGAIARLQPLLGARQMRLQGLPSVSGFHVWPRCKSSSTDCCSTLSWRQKSFVDTRDHHVVRIDHLGEVDLCHL